MRNIDQFIQLKPNEVIVTVVREYLITQAIPLAIGGLAYLTTWFLLYPLFRFGFWGVLAWGVAALLTVGWVARKYYLWYYEVCMVTNLRCVDIQRSGLLNKQVQEIPWTSVRDVTFQQRGLFATLLHFGTVTILLTDQRELVLQHVYQPNQLRDILSEYVQKLS